MVCRHHAQIHVDSGNIPEIECLEAKNDTRLVQAVQRTGRAIIRAMPGFRRCSGTSHTRQVFLALTCKAKRISLCSAVAGPIPYAALMLRTFCRAPRSPVASCTEG